MALVVNTNLSSLQTQYYLNQSQSQLNNALTQLSSGLRINSAADDAAGYAIASGLTSQVNGLTVASQNANNAVSLTQTAEGALQQITTNLQRIRELAVESANATNSSEDRQALNAESQQLIAEVNREAGTAQFNGVNLLDGSFQSQNFQVGANAGQTITVGSSDGFIDARSSALGQTYAATSTFKSTAATGDSSYASTFTGVSATTTSGTATLTTGLAKGALSVNGVSIGKGLSDGVSYIDSKGSAIAVANAINSAGIPNLTATAKAASIASTITKSASYSGSLTNTGTTTSTKGTFSATGGKALRINGISVTGKFNNLQGLESLINDKTSQTGVVASTGSTGELVLTGVDGRNITVMDGAGALGIGAAGGKSSGAATFIGTVSLSTSATTSSAAKITVTDNTNNNKYFGATAINQLATTQTTSIDAVDISTVNGATNALTAIDSALSALNSASASLGAVQNRFQSVVDALASQNQTATGALSTIQDADFAAQTAAYTRAQVLQSAGQSMLAQANSNPQRVLQLLQNL